MVTAAQNPEVTLVIPVFNEEWILEASVRELVEKMRAARMSFSVLLAENGSADRSLEIGERLSRELPEVTIFHGAEPNYGRALKAGILRAQSTFVICEEIDLCDLEFHQRALALLKAQPGIQMVVGSKALGASRDQRPLFRRVATRVFNLMLRLCVGFKGTDTHGLKAFRREAVLPVLHTCLVERDLFASELVIRAQRAGLGVREIPVVLKEKRPPSIALIKRVPRVLGNMVRLTLAIRFGRTA